MTLTYFEQISESYALDFSTSKNLNAGISTGQWSSRWIQGSVPAAAVAPTGLAAAVLSNASAGAIPFVNPVSPRKAYLTEIVGSAFTTFHPGSIELHDRLVHCGGLLGNIVTTQTVSGFDLQTLGGTSNLTARVGAADYSEVLWWLEWYVDTGATASNATVNVTYNNGTTGNLSIVAMGRIQSRMLQLNSLVPAVDSGKFIRGVNSVTLSASTGTAGNFGITATRYLASTPYTLTSHTPVKSDWSQTSIPEIISSSCLFVVNTQGGNAGTSTRLDGKIIYA